MLGHDDGDGERGDEDHAQQPENGEEQEAFRHEKQGHQQRGQEQGEDEVALVPPPVGQRRSRQGADGPACEKGRDEGSGLQGVAPQGVDDVEGDVGQQADLDPGAHHDDADKHEEGEPLRFPRTVLPGGSRVPGRGAGNGDRAPRQQDGGDEDQGGRQHHRQAFEAEGLHDEERQQGADGKAQVAAHGEDGHAGDLPLAREEVGRPESLGMVRGDAEAAQDDQRQDKGEVRGEGQHGEPERCAEAPQGQEQGLFLAVRDVAEKGLDDRGGEGAHQQDGARCRVGEHELRLQERQDDRERALVDVRDEMARGEKKQDFEVEPVRRQMTRFPLSRPGVRDAQGILSQRRSQVKPPGIAAWHGYCFYDSAAQPA